MRPKVECGLCLLKWVYERSLLEGEKSETLIPELIRAIEKELSEDINLGILNNVAIYKAYEVSSFRSPYFNSFKRACNENAKSLLPLAKKFIEDGKDEEEIIVRALKIACAANVSPVGGPRSPYTFEEIKKVVSGDTDISVDPEIVGMISRKERILYFPDNAGEIGFDSLLIELLKRIGKKVVLFVKKAPFFDDATKEDARYFGLESLTESIVENEGFLVPSLLDESKKKVLDSIHLIISKGMGSYEALGEENWGIPVIHMFKVKCVPISKATGLNLGDLRVIMEA